VTTEQGDSIHSFWELVELALCIEEVLPLRGMDLFVMDADDIVESFRACREELGVGSNTLTPYDWR
jgi:hypothetical protein